MIAMADRSRRPLMSVTSLCLPPCFCGKLKLEEAFIDASSTRAKRLAVGPTRRGNGKELDPNQKRLRNRRCWFFWATPILSTAITHELWKNISELSHFVPRTTMPTESWLSVWNVLRTRVRREYWERCLNAIEKSGDFIHKRQRITRAGIAVLAARAARSCGNNERADYWANEAREFLRGDLSVDGAHLNSSRFQRSVL